MPNLTEKDLYVILIGLAIVFIGLVCIILLCKIMSAVCGMAERNGSSANVSPANAPAPATAPAQAAPAVIPNRPEFIAAVSAAIAEEIGKDASSIRILSVKKI